MRVVPLLAIRAGHNEYDHEEYEEEEEADAKEWLSALIEQQAEENVCRDEMSLYSVTEEDGTGYRIEMDNTQKRVVDNIRYNMTAKIPAIEKFYEENEEDLSWMVPDLDEFLSAKIGYVDGEMLFETEDGEPVNTDSRKDYVEWYLDPGGKWELPPMEESWYIVEDADGYAHVAQIQTDESGELYFYGTYLTKNGVETMAALGFIDGELTEVLLGTEDGNSYRTITPADWTGEVEITPVRKDFLFISYFYIPLSQKPILLSPETINSIKVVRKPLDDIEDLKGGSSSAASPAIERTIVIRDIYGYEIEFSADDAEELPVEPEEPVTEPEEPKTEPEEPQAEPEPEPIPTKYLPYNDSFAKTGIFPDVKDPSKSIYKPVYWAVKRGLIKGYSNGYFGPEDSCTREQIVIMLYRYARNILGEDVNIR